MTRSEPHPQPIAGASPKDLDQPDERIRQAIRDKLLGHGSIEASDIQVDVQEGFVTLEGTVPERTMSQYTEDLVNEIPGVQGITNHLSFKESDLTRDPLPH